MIQSITQTVMSNGRTGGEQLWFHPRACLIPAKDGKPGRVFMTAQGISGSDYFHPVHFMYTDDLGATWSSPEPVPGFGRIDSADGIQEGVCDVVPEYHEASDTVLAVGHSVFYRDGKFFLPQPRRNAVYSVWDRKTETWSGKRVLGWDNPDAARIYSSGCAQRHTLPNGDVILPVTFGDLDREDKRVCTVIASYDGAELVIKEAGPYLELPVKRGLLEPSIARFDDRFYLTIRAEDDRGYVVSSEDGLNWSALKAWSWEDGEKLTMSTTQQRWLIHSEGLFLVYTRRDESNVNVMRWRSPLFVARVDPEALNLIRSTEKIAIPLNGDGVNNADHVARMGNFHTVNVSENESWVTVGETLPNDGYRGNTILGRIHWERPNRL